MIKEIPSRITYAQEKIIQLIQERKLRQWCLDNGLPHSAIYRIGMGEQPPSYKIISSMVHLIAPIEWLFFTDEQLPYSPQIIPQWNPDNKCKFITEHRHDYKEVAKKYGIPELSAYNICVSSRAMPSLQFIRECCKDTNPIDFFIAGGEEPNIHNNFAPDRGDIVNIQGNIFLVLSQKSTDGYLVCSPVLKNYSDKVIELKEIKTIGYIKPNNLQTVVIGPRCQASFIETIPDNILLNILQKTRQLFE